MATLLQVVYLLFSKMFSVCLWCSSFLSPVNIISVLMIADWFQESMRSKHSFGRVYLYLTKTIKHVFYERAEQKEQSRNCCFFGNKKKQNKGLCPPKAKHCSNIPVVCLWAFDWKRYMNKHACTAWVCAQNEFCFQLGVLVGEEGTFVVARALLKSKHFCSKKEVRSGSCCEFDCDHNDDQNDPAH